MGAEPCAERPDPTHCETHKSTLRSVQARDVHSHTTQQQLSCKLCKSELQVYSGVAGQHLVSSSNKHNNTPD
eukprot:1153931-Pelagomonas_calceolata.AAC.6